MEYKYKGTPMYRRLLSTKKIMLRLTIGLLIVYAFGLYQASTYGVEYLKNAILLMVVSLAVGTITEILFAVACKKNVIDFLKGSFHFVTCIILVLTVPCNTSLYAMGVSTFIALFFGKLVFGGFGQNVFNPAGVGRAIIATTFANKVALDAISSATVTTAFKSINFISNAKNYLAFINDFGGIRNILIGNYFGALGETCTLLLIVVGVFLAIFDVIDWRIPVTYVGTMFFGTLIIGLTHGLGIDYPLAFVSTGGVMFGAIFMLTDPVTNPQTRPGKILFSIIAALLTILIRYLGNLPEGVVFSILIVNILSPSIDHLFSVKQVDSIKRNIAIVFGSLVLVIVCTILVGISVKDGKYVKSLEPVIEDTSSKTIGDMNFTNNDAIVTELGDNQYHVTVKGYGLINGYGDPYTRNEFNITVKDGAIEKIEVDVFGDTKGMGDLATSDDYLAEFKDATLDSEIDVCTGASYTSKSIMAAVQAVLKEAK